MPTADEAASAVLAGDVRTAARVMRDLDDARPAAVEVMKRLYPHTGRAYVLGVTGNPGAGKSTVVDALIDQYRKAGKRVGVVAVDPSSPFSGGAILGDRIRMQRHATDEGVFIRSLATRGHLGGLSRSTSDVVAVLDAMGFDVVIVETVGVGQDEVDVVSQAETAVVVTVPGLGDEIQAIKAGILEIADVFVVNKADREGSDRVVAELSTMLDFAGHPAWRPPIVKTSATTATGVAEAIQALEAHGAFLKESGEGPKRRALRARSRLLALVEGRFRRAVEARAPEPNGLEEAVRAVVARKEDPYSAAGRLFETVVGAQREAAGKASA